MGILSQIWDCSLKKKRKKAHGDNGIWIIWNSPQIIYTSLLASSKLNTYIADIIGRHRNSLEGIESIGHNRNLKVGNALERIRKQFSDSLQKGQDGSIYQDMCVKVIEKIYYVYQANCRLNHYRLKPVGSSRCWSSLKLHTFHAISLHSSLTLFRNCLICFSPVSPDSGCTLWWLHLLHSHCLPQNTPLPTNAAPRIAYSILYTPFTIFLKCSL